MFSMYKSVCFKNIFKNEIIVSAYRIWVLHETQFCEILRKLLAKSMKCIKITSIKFQKVNKYCSFKCYFT